MTSPLRCTMVATWVHPRTGHIHHEEVSIDLVAATRAEAQRRRAAWDRLAEISRELLPMGYVVHWS